MFSGVSCEANMNDASDVGNTSTNLKRYSGVKDDENMVSVASENCGVFALPVPRDSLGNS